MKSIRKTLVAATNAVKQGVENVIPNRPFPVPGTSELGVMAVDNPLHARLMAVNVHVWAVGMRPNEKDAR
jgi:hypothetical protein